MNKPNDDLTYNDLWRQNNPSGAQIIAILRAKMQREGIEELTKLDDWKLSIISQLMLYLIQMGYTNSLSGLSHYTDGLIMILQCQTEVDYHKMVKNEQYKALKRSQQKSMTPTYKGFL